MNFILELSSFQVVKPAKIWVIINLSIEVFVQRRVGHQRRQILKFDPFAAE